MNLSGKVSLITGGAQGLGRLFSENLLRKGAKVCIADVNRAKGEAAARDLEGRYGDGRVMFVRCDVTSEREFQNAFKEAKERFGRIDVVCNNAGISDESKWRLTLDINLSGVIQGTILAIEHMRRDKGGNGGVIINVASTAGLVPVDFTPAYAASKAGVVAYTRSWATNPANKKTGIRFCALCPSFADTDILKGPEDSVLDVKRYEKALQYVGIMEPEVVGEAFMELVENDNNNGSVLAVTKHHGKRYMPPPPRL